MNLRLILIVALLILIFTSLLLFGYITWGVKTTTTGIPSDHFKANSVWFYADLGIQLTTLAVAGLLFLKR